ncbi:hypothetical protein FYA61_06220 [Bordetella holmesii]|nr:hypothetical protein FYA61_06220 [Bordetella holmesii]
MGHLLHFGQGRWHCYCHSGLCQLSCLHHLARCEDSIGCMHGSSEPDLRNWKSPTPQFTQGARPDEHP